MFIAHVTIGPVGLAPYGHITLYQQKLFLLPSTISFHYCYFAYYYYFY